MTVELGIIFGGSNDLSWLPRVRQWIESNGGLFDKLGLQPVVRPLRTPNEALGWREELPHQRVVMAFGLSRSVFESSRAITSGAPIIVQEGASADGNGTASAGIPSTRFVLSRRDITEDLRKSLIRIAIIQKRIDIRPPLSDGELSGYFSLRYKVWKAVGYLREENKAANVEWEVDFWDRTAVPLCAVTQNEKIVGCVRLISNMGREEKDYVARIQRLLDQADDAQLKKLFKFQNTPSQPFDVLCEFPGFRAKFKELLMSRTSVAEIGRVAVDPQYRGCCLGEVLVDSAVALAQARRVKTLFLACHEKLSPLYAKCGFRPVEGLWSEKFFEIHVPSIVMERRI